MAASADTRFFKGFGKDVEFEYDEGPHGILLPARCNATTVIGVIYTYHIYDLIDKELCFNKEMKLGNLFGPYPYTMKPQLRLFINAWVLHRTIHFPRVHGYIIEEDHLV